MHDVTANPSLLTQLIGPRWAIGPRDLHLLAQRAAELAGRKALELGDVRIDVAARRVWRGEDEVRLTPTEFDLLLCLTATPGAVVTRERLLAEVWGWPGASGTRTVDSHVKGLRAKVGADRIRTVHGVGYALETGTPG